jgi:hypothetical protein
MIRPREFRMPSAAALSATELVCQPIPQSASLLHADHADRDQYGGRNAVEQASSSFVDDAD